MNAPAPSSDDKTMAGICYIGLIACMVPPIIIFVMKKDQSQFIKFHSLQAIGLGLVWAVISFASMVLGFIPVLGWLAQLALTGALFVYWLVVSIQAFQGKDVNIPVVGDFIRKNLMA